MEENNLDKQFDFKTREQDIYKKWEDAGAFHAEPDSTKEPFCVVMPPPNVTGILHMGHVLDNTPQDIMTRWHKMRGFNAVWIPGTDHAGIATQNVVKRQLDEQGIDYKSLTREAFIEKVWEWKEKSGSVIIEQLKRLGCSCDWERERFTMDEGLSKAVLYAFKKYYEKGLIYKGVRMINWCTACGTALANDEVEHEEKNGKIWYLKYPVCDDAGNATEEYVIVATTRPETMLGDTAVAVNPKDERYGKYIGKNLLLPIVNIPIPVIADDYVDPEFGTGAVKITPAHDFNDYEMGKRHDLEVKVVIAEDGTMNEAAGTDYVGLDRYEARKKVVKAFEELELFEKEEKHKNNVGACYRCNSVVEPYVSSQWFVKMDGLAKKAKEVVENGTLSITPESEKNDYFSWLNNIQDWCISRQLWWGHRIPVFYCSDCDHQTVSENPVSECESCSSKNIKQDEDVLDTWFSAQLWPYSTLGWPEETPELKQWFPNSWLMSGRDIIFFWDARMIMSALEFLGDVPFKDLILHGLVRDEKGRKLSKSLNNSPDPIGLFDQYGADAIRASVCFSYPLGRQDTRLGEQVFKRGQSLVIKLWNASRLLFMNMNQEVDVNAEIDLENIEDKWIVARLKKAIAEHDEYLAKSDITHAFETLYQFFWDEFCDWYLEIIKGRLNSDNNEKVLQNSFYVLRNVLKAFHPYIPFVTEEIWQYLGERKLINSGQDSNLLLESSWPKDIADYSQAEEVIEAMVSLVKGVRDIRRELVIPPKEGLSVNIVFSDEKASSKANEYLEIAKRLGHFSQVTVLSEIRDPKGFIPSKFSDGIAYVALPEGVDKEALLKRLNEKVKKFQGLLNGVSKKLQSEDFVKRAPAELVEETKEKVKEQEEAIAKFSEFIKVLE